MFTKTRSKVLKRIVDTSPILVIGGWLGLFGAALLGNRTFAAEEPKFVPAAVHDITTTQRIQTAVLAGGCFWGVQGVFQHVDGVIHATSGYAGGKAETATYELAETGDTGHAEAVRIDFDPQKVSYGKLLQIYFSVAHDPTQVNRQGPDSGTQYRSTIFLEDTEQAKVASDYIRQLDEAGVFKARIATTIESGKPFYKAEDYHQDFVVNHPNQPYVVFNELPKIENLKKLFPQYYRAKPILVSGQS